MTGPWDLMPGLPVEYEATAKTPPLWDLLRRFFAERPVLPEPTVPSLDWWTTLPPMDFGQLDLKPCEHDLRENRDSR